MSNEKRLGRESIRLYVDICSGDVLEEAGLSYVWVPADKECSGVWIDCWKTSQMLTDLLQVKKRVFQAFADCGHATEGRSLEVLALEEGLAILQQSDVVS